MKKKEYDVELLVKLKLGLLIKPDVLPTPNSLKIIENLKNSDIFPKLKEEKITIAKLMFKNGFETEYVAGLLTNFNIEGNFGRFEIYRETKNYMKKIDDKYNYKEKYSNQI